MTTTIALLANRCGLSTSEGAAFLDVRLDTFKSWSSGRNQAKPAVIAELRRLYAKIDDMAGALVNLIKAKAPAGADVEIGYCSDDYEAQQLGLPFASCHRASLGLAIARLDGFTVVLSPRGATMGTAAAIAAHGL